MRLLQKKAIAQKRRWRIRRKVVGTDERLRLAIKFTEKHIYAQCINDSDGKTKLYSSTNMKVLRSNAWKPNLEGASQFGTDFGEKLSNAGIEQVVLDRAGRHYHGTVKAFADAVRKKGIRF